MADSVERVVGVLRAGGLAVVPTDTVYGLACTGFDEVAAQRLYALKGRTTIRPTALVVASVEVLVEVVPEIDARSRALAEALLPGAFTLILPNPARRFAWLNGERPDAIGIRVPALAGDAQQALAGARAIVATSANLPGGPDPRRLEDVPRAILDRVDATLDGGELPGIPSTVLDLTGATPTVIREGSVATAEALARVAAAWPRA